MAILKIKSKTTNSARLEKMKREMKSFKALNLMIDSKLLRKFKTKVADQERTMTDVITKMISEFIA